MFLYQPTVPRLLRQLWLEVAYQQSPSWDVNATSSPTSSSSASSSSRVILDLSSLLGPQSATPAEARSEPPVATGHCFGAVENAIELHRPTDPSHWFRLQDIPNLGDTRPRSPLQLWHCNPYQLDIAVFVFAQRSCGYPLPPVAVLPSCRAAVAELDARVLWIGSEYHTEETVSIGYYLGRFEVTDGGVVVEKSSVEECERKRRST